MKPKLLRCPFCNGTAKIKDLKKITYYVKCSECKASTGTFISSEEAVIAWNKRDGVRYAES